MINNALLRKEYVFISKMILSLLGATVTYAMESMSHYYWLLMLPVFAALELCPIYLSDNHSRLQVCRSILCRWLGGVGCALFVFSLYLSGRLFHEETSLILLSILVLMLYLDCVHKPSLRAAYVLVFLLLLMLAIAYTDLRIGVFVFFSLLALFWSFVEQSKLCRKNQRA